MRNMSAALGATWQWLSPGWTSAQLPFLKSPTSPSKGTSSIRIDTKWDLLGPFQIGTREWPWSSDPLYAPDYGGFHNLKRSEDAHFPSSLAPNGSVTWTGLTGNVSDSGASAETALTASFDNVDWSSLRSIYGWAATQYQAWAKGHFYLRSNETRTYEIYTTRITEFWLDEEHYFGGDFYGFERAPLTLSIPPGAHTLDVRLMRDVRAMGGLGRPTIDATIRVKAVDSRRSIVLEPGLIADVVNGSLVSPLASVVARNPTDKPLEIFSIDGDAVDAALVSSPIRLHPGQTRPLALKLQLCQKHLEAVKLSIAFSVQGTSDVSHAPITLALAQARGHSFQKMTYLHPSGIVSYGMLRPPMPANTQEKALPILVALHGAGVEADSDLMRHSFDAATDLPAWTLVPSGVTSWSGDDWHEWGWADVEAAIAAIPDWIKQTRWEGRAAEPNRLLLTGHSNGGQGVWYATLHHPGRVIAAAIISGYSSIQQYVPYTFWHEAYPQITEVLQSALKPYRHELMLPNANGLPILIQHGSADDNVPPYHARRMVRLASEAQIDVEYHELPGKGHWFEGVMTTRPLLNFYAKHLKQPPPTDHRRTTAIQRGQAFAIKEQSNINVLLGTVGPFHVRYCNEKVANVALEISRNLYQYLAADCTIIDSCDNEQNATGNTITVGIGKDISQGDGPFAIKVVEDHIVMRDRAGSQTYMAGSDGLAAIFLRPLQDNRLELVVWGEDVDSLRVVARLLPFVPGAGQPHFVVTTRVGLYKGASSALAMGFFESDWSIAHGAYLR